MFLSVIIPTLNEEDNIVPLISSIERYTSEDLLEIIVVDDNSSDATRERIFALNHPKVKVIHRVKDLGFTNSISAGVGMAKGEYIAWLDGDFSHPPSLLPKMIDAARSADVVIASRFLKGSVDLNKKESVLLYVHKLLSLVLSYLGRWFISSNITDYSSGYILLRKEKMPQKLQGDYGEYFIDLLGYFVWSKCSVVELAYTSPPRSFGRSKTANSLKDLWLKGYKYLFMMWRVFWAYRRKPLMGKG